MALDLTTLRVRVLNILQKESSYQGFYTTTKLDQAINESMDYIAARAMHEMGEGWYQEITYITTTGGTESYNLPTGTALVREVRYLYGSTYIPLRPLEAVDEAWLNPNASNVILPWRYELIGGKIYFNPVPNEVGTDFLQLKVTKFPTALVSGSDTLPTQFNNALEWYLIYRSASALNMAVGNENPEWQRMEGEWFDVMKQMITGRIKKPKYVKEFRF